MTIIHYNCLLLTVPVRYRTHFTTCLDFFCGFYVNGHLFFVIAAVILVCISGGNSSYKLTLATF